VRATFIGILTVVWTTTLLAQPERVERIAQQLVEGMYELRGGDRAPEQALISKGLSAQDADRTIHEFMHGFVMCLLNELRADAAGRGQPFSENLLAMEQSLDRSGAKSVLHDLILVAQARGPQSEGCALNELQKAGLSLDAIPTK
jgi:hypothetical protein